MVKFYGSCSRLSCLLYDLSSWELSIHSSLFNAFQLTFKRKGWWLPESHTPKVAEKVKNEKKKKKKKTVDQLFGSLDINLITNFLVRLTSFIHFSFWISLPYKPLIDCWCNYVSGSAFDLLATDGSKSRWPTCAGDSSYVQDRQGQVWKHCSELDTEICHGIVESLGGTWDGRVFLKECNPDIQYHCTWKG